LINRALAHLLSGEDGYSLMELLVVMVILGIVLGGLTTVFVSGSNAEVDLNRRFQAQQQARLALDKIRTDIHCASAAQAQTIGTYPGLKLAVGNCYPSTPTVSWCAVPATTPTRTQVYRSTATSSICTSSDATRLLVADSIVSGSTVFTTATVPQYSLQTVGVDFKVSVNPTTTSDVYELKDSLVARNSTRCATSGGCSVPTVP
jgi:prepilin-type N-terminal cleavage/methylation domain-containing protein